MPLFPEYINLHASPKVSQRELTLIRQAGCEIVTRLPNGDIVVQMPVDGDLDLLSAGVGSCSTA